MKKISTIVCLMLVGMPFGASAGKKKHNKANGSPVLRMIDCSDESLNKLGALLALEAIEKNNIGSDVSLKREYVSGTVLTGKENKYSPAPHSDKGKDKHLTRQRKSARVYKEMKTGLVLR